MESLDAKHAATLFLGLGVGIAIGWVLKSGRLLRRRKSADMLDEMSRLRNKSSSGDYKMVLVVRSDLKMGKGKIAAQCAHAAVASVEKCFNTNQDLLMAWRSAGQPKVVVKTEDEPSLITLAKTASAAGLRISVIQDAGRTQIAPGTRTVLGVGPGPSELVDKVTGHLKLL